MPSGVKRKHVSNVTVRCKSVEVLRSGELTLIMALEVIRNKVALSVTCLILSPMSPPTRNPSSSDRDLRGQEAVQEQLTTCSMTVIKN